MTVKLNRCSRCGCPDYSHGRAEEPDVPTYPFPILTQPCRECECKQYEPPPGTDKTREWFIVVHPHPDQRLKSCGWIAEGDGYREVATLYANGRLVVHLASVRAVLGVAADYPVEVVE